MAISPERTYLSQLESQIEINREQLYELRSLLHVERLKTYLYLTFITVTVSLVGALTVGVFVGGVDYHSDHLAALINIGAVFALFGLFEALSFLTNSFSLSTRLRRLVSRQLRALADATEELAISGEE